MYYIVHETRCQDIFVGKEDEHSKNYVLGLGKGVNGDSLAAVNRLDISLRELDSESVDCRRPYIGNRNQFNQRPLQGANSKGHMKVSPLGGSGYGSAP